MGHDRVCGVFKKGPIHTIVTYAVYWPVDETVY